VVEMRKITSIFLVFSIIILNGNLYAKERRGALVEIYKTKPGTELKMEGTPWETALADINGELIAVKQNSLLLVDSKGADVTVNINEIKVIKIVKKSKGLLFAGIGLLIGIGIPYLALEAKEEFAIGRGTVAVGGGILGALIGLFIGAATGVDKTYKMEGSSESEIQEILEDLRKKARVPDFQ